MFFYKVDIEIIEAKLTHEIIRNFPQLEFTVGTEIELSDICLMQFVRKATADFAESLEGVEINATEGQLHWNKYTGANFDDSINGYPVVIEFTGFKLVDAPCVWHIEANPLELLRSLYFTSTTADGILPDTDDQIWFDCYLPNVMTKESEGDFDNEVRASGLVIFDRTNGEVNIKITDEFSTCQSIFNFTESKKYFSKLLSCLFSQKGFRRLDISGDEILDILNK